MDTEKLTQDEVEKQAGFEFGHYKEYQEKYLPGGVEPKDLKDGWETVKHADGTDSTAFHVGNAHKTGIGGVTNPAGDESVNPNLAPWVDADGKTHHVVEHPSANNVDYVIGKMPKVIDEIANPYMMAEQATTSVNGWVLAAAASAVAGVALLASSSRKAAVTEVPV